MKITSLPTRVLPLFHIGLLFTLEVRQAMEHTIVMTAKWIARGLVTLGVCFL